MLYLMERKLRAMISSMMMNRKNISVLACCDVREFVVEENRRRRESLSINAIQMNVLTSHEKTLSFGISRWSLHDIGIRGRYA